MKFSSAVTRLSGEGADSWEVHYEGLARLEAGEDIIMLSVGQETDQATSTQIVGAAKASLDKGRHHYAPVNGNLDLRQAIAQRHRALTRQSVTATHCTVFAGAQNALFAVAQCLLEHGDEVILIDPYYSTYPATFSASGATLVSVPAKPENHFQINPDDIIAQVTSRTRAIVLNSPNNPTGAVYMQAQFTPLVEACVREGIWLISDEVYQEILPEDERCSPAGLPVPGAESVCVTVSSLSKSHRMTGWRLGWAVGPERLMHALYNLSMCMSYGLPQFIMDAAVVALGSTQTADEISRAMSSRRQLVLEQLDNVAGMEIFSAGRGMFVVLDIRKLPLSGKAFARGLLDRQKVAVLPCDGFGQVGKDLIRMSLCASEEQLVTACQRIVAFANSTRVRAGSNAVLS